MPSLGLLFQAWKCDCCFVRFISALELWWLYVAITILFWLRNFSVLRQGSMLTPKMWRQQATRSCIKFQLLSIFIPNRLRICPTQKPIRRLKLCFWIFFTALEVKMWHSEIRQLPKYLFFIWIIVAGAPRTPSRQFSPVAGAYGDLCFVIDDS